MCLQSKIRSNVEALVQSVPKVLLIIFISAFLVRLIFILTLENKWYFYDTVHYDKAGQSILAGEGFGTGYRFSGIEELQKEYSLPPVYPIFLSTIYWVFGRDFLAVRLVQAIIGASISILMFLIGREIYNKKVGIIAAVVASVYPYFVFISGLLYVTVLFTFLILVFIWFALKSFDDDNIWSPILAGLFLGLATLSGPILFALYPFVLAWFLILSKRPMISRLKSICILFGATIVTLTPWGIRNYFIFDRITPVSASVDWFLAEAQSRVYKNLKVKIRSEESANKFEIYVNDRYDGAFSDSTIVQKKELEYYSGVMLGGGFSNNIDRFEIVSNSANEGGKHIVEEFDEKTLSARWTADSSFRVMNGELINTSTNRKRDFLAIYNGLTNPTEVAIRWGKDAEASGVGATHIVLLADRPNPHATGYLLKRHAFGLLELWLMEDGKPRKLLKKLMGEKALASASNEEKEGHTSENRDGIICKIIHIVTDDFKGFSTHYVAEFVHFWQLYPDRVTTKNNFTDWKTKFLSILIFAPILVFASIGVLFSVKNNPKSALMLFTIMSFAFGYAFFQTRARYRIPIEPYLIIFAAQGFLMFLKKFLKFFRNYRLF